MPIAAVPHYLGQDFKEASPGMRFGMYLKLWGINRRTHALLWETYDTDYEVRGQQREEREVRKENKVEALTQAKQLGQRDKRAMEALAARQAALAQTVAAPSLLRLDAKATAPFTTGLGNEHPLENGFAFLNPYGLPYLPGSGVKGVVRRAAQELASGMWEDDRGWRGLDQPAYTVTFGSGKSRVSLTLSVLDVLFGREPPAGDSNAIRGALAFWDVIPQIEGSSLMVEIMTPHQSHYYQQGTSPHDSGQPNPISFLTVPPGSGFAFHVVCDGVHLARLTEGKGDGALDLLAEGPTHWKTLLTAAFEHAFEWLGFGAKTSVGYGAMATEAMRKTREEQQRARREAERLAEEHRKQEQAQANAEIWEGARIKFNRKNKSLSVEKGGKTAIAIAPKGEELLAKLPDEVRKKIETDQFVKVTARVAGNDLLEVIP